MWRQHSPEPRNCSLRDGAATYLRPTHKNGYVARHISVLRCRFRVPLQEDGPGEAVMVGRNWDLPDDEAAAEPAIPLAADRRRDDEAVGGATFCATRRKRVDAHGAPGRYSTECYAMMPRHNDSGSQSALRASTESATLWFVFGKMHRSTMDVNDTLPDDIEALRAFAPGRAGKPCRHHR
jgi:hypothetical protein